MLDCAAESRSPIFSSSSSLPRRGAGDLNALFSDVPAAGITPRASPRSPDYGVRAANDSQLARVGRDYVVNAGRVVRLGVENVQGADQDLPPEPWLRHPPIMTVVGHTLALELAVVEYVAWFNNERLHEALDDQPPREREEQYAEQRAANPTPTESWEPTQTVSVEPSPSPGRELRRQLQEPS
jgi:hypothetical protein